MIIEEYNSYMHGGKYITLGRKLALIAEQNKGGRRILLLAHNKDLVARYIEELRKDLKDIAIYSLARKTFIFTNGSSLRVDYCDGEQELQRYYGMEFDLMGFEHINRFTPYVLRYLRNSLRSRDFEPMIYYTIHVDKSFLKDIFIDDFKNLCPEDLTRQERYDTHVKGIFPDK